MPRFPVPGARMHMNHGRGLMPLPQQMVHHQHHDFHQEENYGEEEFYGEGEEYFEEEGFDEYAGEWEEPQQHAGWHQSHPLIHQPPHGPPMMRPRPPVHMRPEVRHRMHGMPPHPHFPMRPQVPRMGMRMMRPTRPMFRPPHMTHH